MNTTPGASPYRTEVHLGPVFIVPEDIPFPFEGQELMACLYACLENYEQASAGDKQQVPPNVKLHRVFRIKDCAKGTASTAFAVHISIVAANN